jgi:hypothetical protein
MYTDMQVGVATDNHLMATSSLRRIRPVGGTFIVDTSDVLKGIKWFTAVIP